MTFLERFTALSPYLIAVVVALMVAAVLWRGHRASPGRGHFAVLMFCVAGWAFFNFLEDSTNLLRAKFAYANLQYLFIGAIPVLFLQFSLRTTLDPLPRKFLDWRFQILLWAIPLTMGGVVWLDLDLGVVRRIDGLVTIGDFTNLDREWTIVFWAFTLYSYSLISVALFLWGRYLVRRRHTLRAVEIAPFAAVFLPWIGNVAFVSGLQPWPGHDPTPPLFAVMGLILATTLRNNRFFALLPEAQEVVMDTWPGPLLVLDGRHRLRFFNQGAGRLWGLNRDHLGRTAEDLLPWLGGASAGSLAPRKVTDAGRQVWEVEGKLIGRKAGAQGRLLIFRDLTGHMKELAEHSHALESAYSQLSTVHDRQKQTEQQIFFYSLHDSLTALANRSLLLSRLGQSMGLFLHEGGIPYSLLAIDMVNFKGINDAHGHLVGDSLIRETAQRLKASLRDTDVAARITADRFFAILNGTNDPSLVLEAVERIRKRLEEPVSLDHGSILPQYRYAVVLGDRDAATPEVVIDDAESTLARMKASSEVGVVVFQKAWRDLRQENRMLLEDLSRAFSTRQISLVYQPIVDAVTYQMVGVEALIRWNHPTLGPISPTRMIELAESEGLIAPLGLWVLREATSFLVRVSRGHLALQTTYVSVNVSPKQLLDPDFGTIVAALMESSGLEPSRLHLEITESSLVAHADQVIPQLEALRALGVKIKLDDFGTGYSSLHSLHELPVDTLKIDRSFVIKLPQSRPIVTTILDLARKLGIDSIAEGVENKGQLDELVDLECRQIQGFLFSKGLSEADFTQWLAQAEAGDLELKLLPRTP